VAESVATRCGYLSPDQIIQPLAKHRPHNRLHYRQEDRAAAPAFTQADDRAGEKAEDHEQFGEEVAVFSHVVQTSGAGVERIPLEALDFPRSRDTHRHTGSPYGSNAGVDSLVDRQEMPRNKVGSGGSPRSPSRFGER